MILMSVRLSCEAVTITVFSSPLSVHVWIPEESLKSSSANVCPTAGTRRSEKTASTNPDIHPREDVWGLFRMVMLLDHDHDAVASQWLPPSKPAASGIKQHLSLSPFILLRRDKEWIFLCFFCSDSLFLTLKRMKERGKERISHEHILDNIWSCYTIAWGSSWSSPGIKRERENERNAVYSLKISRFKSFRMKRIPRIYTLLSSAPILSFLLSDPQRLLVFMCAFINE